MKKRLIYLMAFVILIVVQSNAQQNMRISDVTNAPASASSVLEVESTTKGMLVPRMSTVQRLAIANPANGLLVYDTNVECFMFYTAFNTTWNYLCNTGSGGANTILTSQIAPGATCANGGVLLQFGNDANGNGQLDPTEINNTLNQYVCNGTAGAQGPQGVQGPAGPQGPPGSPAPACVPTSLGFNSNGTLSYTDNCGNTITSPNGAWLIGGNTNPPSNNLGQTGNAPINFITNNQNRFSVEANGDIFVDGSKPIVIRRFFCNGCDNPNRNTGVSSSTYSAVIAGFYPTQQSGPNAQANRARVYVNGGTWWFKGDMQDATGEDWTVDIMFIKRQLVDDQRPNSSNGTSGATGF
jgi:hypothetical protein